MILKLAWRNIWKNRKRSIITILSIFVAVFLALFIRSMQLGMYDSVIDNVAGKFTGYLQIHSQGYWEDRNLDNALAYSGALRNKILQVEGIEDIVPRIETYALASMGKRSKGVFINGVNPGKEQKLTAVGKRLTDGEEFHESEAAVIIGKGLSRYFGLAVGDTLFLIGQGYHGMSAAGKFLVKGIIDMKNRDLNRSIVMMPIKVLRDYLSAPEIVTSLIAVKTENADEIKIQQDLQSILQSGKHEVMTWQEMIPELHQAIVADNIGGLYMVFILYMVISFGIFSTVLMMTQERIFEFGILTALGMKKSLIIKTLWVETGILSLLGLLSGMLPAYPLMLYFHKNPMPLPSEKADVMEKFGFLPEIAFSVDPEILLYHGALIFFISLIIVFYPTFKILNLNTLKAMHKK
jgi:ABC-type lipoprotein release transport system permease subunit